MRRLEAWLASVLILVSGCSDRAGSDRPITLTNAAPLTAGWAAMLPGGDYRMVTVRQREDDTTPVLCSEPSPDWAVAFGRAVSGSGSANVAGKASGALSGSLATTEAVTAMLGRTAGVVALRDGLYSACQAYVNGVIGKSAYALILSQYGNLLVSLASGGGGAGGGDPGKAAGSAATPAGVAVAVSTGAAGGGGAKSGGDGGGGGGGGGNAQVAIMQQEAIQAMLVSCLTAGDPTVRQPRGVYPGMNPILEANCEAFMSHFENSVEGLLRPAWAGGEAAKPKPVGDVRRVPRRKQHVAMAGSIGRTT